MKNINNIRKYRKIIVLMSSRIDRSECTKTEFIEYMKEMHGHD